MDREIWMNSYLAPSIVNCETFKNNISCIRKSEERLEIATSNVVSLEYGKDHFASSVFLLNLELNVKGVDNKDMRRVCSNLLVKQVPEDESLREFINADVMFTNESVVYVQLIPYIQIYLKQRLDKYLEDRERSVNRGDEAHGDVFDLGVTLFPACYYVSSDRDEFAVIALENLKRRGFSSCREVFLDHEHCWAAFRELARFHAISYAMKEHEPDNFYRIVDSLKETRYTDNSSFGNSNFLPVTTQRAMNYLVENGGVSVFFTRRFQKLIENPYDLMKTLVEPQEPLAVICHGDFCKNNIFFSYDKYNKPNKVKFFDFQTVRYSSPAIDLAFMLYLNTTSAFREEYWDTLLECYHSELLLSLSQLLSCVSDQLDPKFGIDKFRQDFAEHAVYGYIICSFFLPLTMDCGPTIDLQEVANNTISEDQLLEFYRSGGGLDVTHKLVDIVMEYEKRGYY